MFPSSLVRGRRPEAFLKVERGRRSRGCTRNVVSGGAETAIRALRPVCEELAARCPGGNARARKRGTASENRRWSAERRASPIARGRGAPRTRPARARNTGQGCDRKHPAPSRRSAAPHRAEEEESKTRAHQRAAGTKKRDCPPTRERRRGLFDIVKRTRRSTGATREFGGSGTVGISVRDSASCGSATTLRCCPAVPRVWRRDIETDAGAHGGRWVPALRSPERVEDARKRAYGRSARLAGTRERRAAGRQERTQR